MNEQVIAKLVKQAGISRSMKECFEKNWNDIDRESPIGWYICTQARFENFIELIVQECAKVILETSVQYNEIDTMHRIRDNVKEHFGVEQ